MSNKEYDTLYDELLTLEEETGIVMTDSPTHNIGYEVVSELPKERHQKRMLSLDKTKSVDVLKEWLGDKQGYLSFKEDGLTCVLTYKDGELTKGVTRGNGEIGELVTPNVKTIKNIPLHIPYKEELVIRGEAVITYSEFERINNEIKDADSKYKNPRNLCSGSLRQLDSQVTDKRNLKFIAFRIVTKSPDIPTKYSEQLLFLEKLGFEPVIGTHVTKNNLDCMVSKMGDMLSTNDIPSDGLVLTYDDTEYGESLGETEKFPKHSIAFKWNDDTYPTKLLDIEWNAGKTGVLTPVAIFEPVEIDGTTVERASIHNVSILSGLKLGIGDEIEVYKSNMIIPQVYKNNTCSDTYKIPVRCPVCGGETKVVKDNSSKILMCQNPSCEGKLLGRLSQFVSKKGMDIDGLSEATLEKFINLGWVKNIYDIYNLDPYYDKLVKMDGFGIQSVRKLDTAIRNSLRNVELSNFITSLSIPGIGIAQAKELAKKFHSWSEFQNAGFGNYNFTKLEGFGEVLNRNIHEWFQVMWDEDKIGELVDNILFKETSDNKNILKGKSFAITGKLIYFHNRYACVKAIEDAGGKYVTGVTSKTDYLVNNSDDSSSSKNQKAKKLGIPIITEAKLAFMLENEVC